MVLPNLNKKKSISFQSEVRKRGKRNKRNFHHRFVTVDNGEMKVYQKKKHYKNGRVAKYTLNVKYKNVKAAVGTPSAKDAFCSCMKKLAQRYFVKITDMITNKTDILLEVANKKAATSLRKAIRA